MKGQLVSLLVNQIFRSYVLLPILIFGFGLALRAAEDPTSAYVAQIEQWRAKRLSELKADEGWLTLVGLHFLQPGTSTIGSAGDNAIVLPSGPKHLGAVILKKTREVDLRVNPGVDALVDGRHVLATEIHNGYGGPPALVTSGSLSFYVLERGGKPALRVRDTRASARLQFKGLEYFPIDLSWRVEARWEPYPRIRRLSMSNTLGQKSEAMVLGEVVFEREGRHYRLVPLQSRPGAPLFFIISDATSGQETYGTARFLYADAPRDGRVVLDFNKLINPPRAFTPFATCPLPPAMNRLEVPIRAGEKRYLGLRSDAAPAGGAPILKPGRP